ncbi:MAG: transposase [Desulfobaccales bacterium]|jgi:UDP-sulfoquinovose synthase
MSAIILILIKVFRQFEPEAVIHYAEQPAAPYYMMGHQQAIFTLTNNLVSTANLIHAVKECNPDCHIIKLGTMRVYGTPNIDIEEDYLEVAHKGRKHKFLYPETPGSLYHLTKAQNGDMLYFYCRIWSIRVTDLNQGPVYGVETEESSQDDRLFPIFNYDDIFGTVLNRFLVQAVGGFPLKVYGKGGQTRGYLNLKDTLACMELSLLNPAAAGEYRVFNQFVETFSVNDLAQKVQEAGRDLGLKVEIQHIANPRSEAEEHYYNPAHTGLLSLGLQPHYLDTAVLRDMLGLVQKYSENIDPGLIVPQVRWYPTRVCQAARHSSGTNQGRQKHLRWDKTSCQRFEANQTRLKMGVLAYNLLHMIRQFYVWGEEVKRSMDWLIKRLIKVGARFSYQARRWYVQVASAFPLAHHYRAVLAWGP